LIPDNLITVAIELIRKSGEAHYLPVSGVSMRPFLYDGDMVLVSPYNDQLEQGDLIVYQASGLLITHRVLHIIHSDKKGATFITKGDNSIVPDPPIKSSAIIGKVVAIRRKNHEMRLDNPLWRTTNNLIGAMMSVLMKLYSTIVGPRTTKTGVELGLFNRFVRRGMITLSSLVTKLLQVIIGRWTPYNAT